jgi:hypothetical protein
MEIVVASVQPSGLQRVSLERSDSLSESACRS